MIHIVHVLNKVVFRMTPKFRYLDSIMMLYFALVSLKILYILLCLSLCQPYRTILALARLNFAVQKAFG